MKNDVPTYMRSTIKMLQRTYGNVIPQEDYIPLICVLLESPMSQRSVADALALLLGGESDDYIIDVSSRAPTTEITLNELERIREKLKPYGYKEWLQDL